MLNGNLNILKYLVSKGANVNAGDKNLFTPLVYAVLQGDLEMVKYLVSAGANVKERFTMAGVTLLHLAVSPFVKRNKFKILNYLLSLKRIDINARTSIGIDTPLHFAAADGEL